MQKMLYCSCYCNKIYNEIKMCDLEPFSDIPLSKILLLEQVSYILTVLLEYINVLSMLHGIF